MCPSIYLSIYPSISIHLSIYLSFYSSIYLSIHPSISISIYLSLSLSIYIYLSIYILMLHRHHHLEGADQCDLRFFAPLFEALRRCVDIIRTHIFIYKYKNKYI